MAEFYRFRSIDSLLGKHRELEGPTIYFASPEELNDPMEGLRDIVWDGDEIVWTNFFKHYVFCLNRSCLVLMIKTGKLDVDRIPILGRWDQMTTPIEQVLFDDIWEKFCNLPHIQEIIEALANTKRKIRYREIVFYLGSIQTFGLLDEIQKSYIDHLPISESQTFQSPQELSKAVGMEMLLNGIKQSKEYGNEDVLDAVYQISEEMHHNIELTVQYNTRTHPPEILDGINRMTMLDFPKVYVEQLDRLLWTKWYTACFAESYHKSTMWGQYAEGHKGVCLIFEAKEKDNSNSLELNNNSIILPFRKVHYEDNPSETDFFRTICRIPVGTLRELWYTDQNGEISECAAHIESDSDEAVWKELYWKNFFRDITFKTKDWVYEQEHRLVLEDGLAQFNEKDDRALTYDFSSLKGIIFGIRTPTEDKVKIIEIMEEKKKCSENNQTDFKYFQAYYSANDGKIHKREIQLR